MSIPIDNRNLVPKPFADAPPAFAVRLVLAIRRLLRKLADSLGPAELAIFERSIGVVFTQAVGYVARHGVADLLESGPQTAEELARKSGLNADALRG